MELAKVCLIVLNCIGSGGINPDYLHSMEMKASGELRVKWDGNWNDVVRDVVQGCFWEHKPPVDMVCEYHNDPDKEWVDPQR